MRIFALCGAAALALTAVGAAAEPRLEPIFSSDLVVNGAATGDGGRLFLPVQPQAPGAGPEVVEVRDGKPVPYPDPRWNA